jgi:riboflavin kinase/FMN adenylyltransferase
MGVPTANLEPCVATELAWGVYAGYAFVGDTAYRAAISVGAPTTFGEEKATIEPHLLDFDGDLYGQEITLSFVEYLRPLVHFNSVEELKTAIADDIARISQHLS